MHAADDALELMLVQLAAGFAPVSVSRYHSLQLINPVPSPVEDAPLAN